MHKFIIRGKSTVDNDSAQFSLDIPPAKKFEVIAIRNSENIVQTSLLLNCVVSRSKLLSSHARPVAMVGDTSTYLPGSFRQLLHGHPYPVSQGPVMIPLDANTDPKKLPHLVLRYKTVFTHSHTQKCVEWVPVVDGIPAWTKDEETFSVGEKMFRIHGAASGMDMGLLYTCHMSGWSLSGCVIHCQCCVCSQTKSHCQDRHRKEPCNLCNSQCTTHQILLQRLFNSETDHFSIITGNVNKYRFAYRYAGIPKSCESCTKDVLEHQVLHLVFHVRCRFCRYEMRPLVEGDVITFDDFKKMEKILNERDDRTCSVCLQMSTSCSARQKHESVVHKKETQKLKCDLCDKTYSNKNALKYHIGKHSGVDKPSCEICGKQFSSERSMARHKLNIHEDGSNKISLDCEVCGQSFSIETALKRHQREQHFDKLNVDFLEGSNTPAIYNCEQCDMTFKRHAHLKRHILSVHSEKKFSCSICDRTYTRKDVLDRHVAAKHAVS